MNLLRTLYGRLALVLLGIFCLTAVALAVILYFTLQSYQQEVAQRLHRQLAAHIAETSALYQKGRVDQDVLKSIFMSAMKVNPSIEIYHLDPEGRVLAYEAEHGRVKRERVSIEPIERFLAGEASFPLQGDDPRQQDGRKIFSVAPLGGDERRGYLYVILRGEQLEGIAEMVGAGYLPRLSSMAIVVSLLFALLAGLAAFALLTRRLRRLTAKVESMRAADFKQLPEPLPSPKIRDELDRLDQAFTDMARRIRDQMRQLSESDRMRRELVANVSHDLRTPLAVLQGYLDTLSLHQGRLLPEVEREYLEVARRHAGRLGGLVDQLFELAKLDSGESRPRAEPFPIAELIQDVVQEFQLSARERGVALKLQAPASSPFVLADISMIERVLENLIENALRHTPTGGSVDLRLAPNGTEVGIEVQDTGAGIAAEHLPYVFERFYRASTERGGSGGAGLGLAIARRVLELHGRDISIESREGAGATFRFSLATCQPGSDENVKLT